MPKSASLSNHQPAVKRPPLRTCGSTSAPPNKPSVPGTPKAPGRSAPAPVVTRIGKSACLIHHSRYSARSQKRSECASCSWFSKSSARSSRGLASTASCGNGLWALIGPQASTVAISKVASSKRMRNPEPDAPARPRTDHVKMPKECRLFARYRQCRRVDVSKPAESLTLLGRLAQIPLGVMGAMLLPIPDMVPRFAILCRRHGRHVPQGHCLLNPITDESGTKAQAGEQGVRTLCAEKGPDTFFLRG